MAASAIELSTIVDAKQTPIWSLLGENIATSIEEQPIYADALAYSALI